MTTIEFSNEFDIKWDNLRFNNSDTPSLNDYEKSIFLTTAQENWIINNHKNFENSEFVRRALAPIVKTLSIDGETIGVSTKQMGIFVDELKSLLIDVPADAWLIVHEQAKLNGKRRDVVPITHDEFNVLIDNPFRKPNDTRMWRMDFNRNDKEQIELIIASGPSVAIEYFNRYVTRPKPIVLDGVFETEDNNLSIRGQISPQTSVLNDIVHETILDDAINLASDSLIISNNK